MKKIKLTQNKYAIVDDEDFDLVKNYTWRYSCGYATTFIYKGKINGKYKSDTMHMHRLINHTPKNYITDHINRNKLDNRKLNLRTVNKSQNALNTGIWSHNKSGYKGISWDKINKKWRANIQINSITLNLGRYFNLIDAIKARQNYEQRI